MTKECFVYSGHDSSSKKDFYRLPIPLGLPKGEYQYYICAATGTLRLNAYDPRKSTIDGLPIEIYDQGVAQVGKIAREGQTNYNILKTYEQYEG